MANYKISQSNTQIKKIIMKNKKCDIKKLYIYILIKYINYNLFYIANNYKCLE
mgnify:CR=1 FL=1